MGFREPGDPLRRRPARRDVRARGAGGGLVGGFAGDVPFATRKTRGEPDRKDERAAERPTFWDTAPH